MRRPIVWFFFGFVSGAALLWIVVTSVGGWYVYVSIGSNQARDHYASLGCEPQIIGGALWMKCPRSLYWTSSQPATPVPKPTEAPKPAAPAASPRTP